MPWMNKKYKGMWFLCLGKIYVDNHFEGYFHGQYGEITDSSHEDYVFVRMNSKKSFDELNPGTILKEHLFCGQFKFFRSQQNLNLFVRRGLPPIQNIKYFVR